MFSRSGLPRILASLVGVGLLAGPTLSATASPAAMASGSVTTPTYAHTLAPMSSPAGPDVGSAPLGSTSYPVPSDAIVVSPGGDDRHAGTVASPLRTVAAALEKVKKGGRSFCVVGFTTRG